MPSKATSNSQTNNIFFSSLLFMFLLYGSYFRAGLHSVKQVSFECFQCNSNSMLVLKGWSTNRFCEILARNYAPGAAAPGTAAPGAWIIWDNILSSICSRSIIWTYTAPGVYLDMPLEHCAFYICSWSIFAICSWSIVHSNMLLEHIWLRILP